MADKTADFVSICAISFAFQTNKKVLYWLQDLKTEGEQAL